MQKGCGCSEDCYGQFTEDELYDIQLTMHELSKQEKDMLLLGKLQVLICPGEVIHARKVSKAKHRRNTYLRPSLCLRKGFSFLHGIGEKSLKNLHSHIKEHGILPRQHGNKGCLPENVFSFETIKKYNRFYR